jgi:hypothetical protein
MRNRERIIRIISEESKKMGLDPSLKENFDIVVDSIKNRNEKIDKKVNVENNEETLEVQEEKTEPEATLAPKKKNNLPPKKKKTSE